MRERGNEGEMLIYIYHMVIAQCTYCRIGPKSMIYRISTSNEV